MYVWHDMYAMHVFVCLCSQFNSLNGKYEWQSLSASCVTFGNINSRIKWKNNGTLFISDKRLSISCSSVWTFLCVFVCFCVLCSPWTKCFGVDIHRYTCICLMCVCALYVSASMATLEAIYLLSTQFEILSHIKRSLANNIMILRIFSYFPVHFFFVLCHSKFFLSANCLNDMFYVFLF